jgi:hypothetical protein
MRKVALDDVSGVAREVLLAPLTGADEAALDGAAGPELTLSLLRRLGREADGGPLALDGLAVSQADRLAAWLYRDLYGDCAECRARCADCGEDYEFAIDVAALIARQDGERPGPPDGDGFWALADGRRVRAPTLADLAAADGPDALLGRLVAGGDPAADPDRVTAFLETAAPLLSIDVDAACPHCARGQNVRFDLAHYLAARLAGERPFLVREIHLLASRYGWGLAEILALSRADRRAFAALIESERAAGARALRRAG